MIRKRGKVSIHFLSHSNITIEFISEKSKKKRSGGDEEEAERLDIPDGDDGIFSGKRRSQSPDTGKIKVSSQKSYGKKK